MGGSVLRKTGRATRSNCASQRRSPPFPSASARLGVQDGTASHHVELVAAAIDAFNRRDLGPGRRSASLMWRWIGRRPGGWKQVSTRGAQRSIGSTGPSKCSRASSLSRSASSMRVVRSSSPTPLAFEGERGSRRSREAPWATSFMAVASHAFSLSGNSRSLPSAGVDKDTGFCFARKAAAAPHVVFSPRRDNQPLQARPRAPATER